MRAPDRRVVVLFVCGLAAILVSRSALAEESLPAAAAPAAKKRAVKQIRSLTPGLKVTAKNGAPNVASEGGATPVDDRGLLELSLDPAGLPATSLQRAYEAGSSINATAGSVDITGQDGLTVTGNVGIGTSTPTSRFEVSKPDVGILFRVLDEGLTRAYGDFESRNGRGDVVNLVVQDGGNVGIGASTPTSRFEVSKPDVGILFRVLDEGLTRAYGDFESRNGRGDVVNLVVQDGGNVGIGTSAPTAKLEVAGTTKTNVLEVMGGDLAERFPIAEDGVLQPGTIVSIDTLIEGRLRRSGSAYDRRVAGVVSGAGDLHAGVVLRGDGPGTPVAVAGRVWCMADTSNGQITPGDLLTTSGKAGHAMRVTDHMRAQGAVLGKAMTSLAVGEGLVLVLVSLQ